jgi:hypothetical protein
MFWDNSFFTNSLDNLFSKSDLQMLLSSAYGGGGADGRLTSTSCSKGPQAQRMPKFFEIKIKFFK